MRWKFPKLKIAIIYVTASPETILTRAKKRAEATGRLVPEEVRTYLNNPPCFIPNFLTRLLSSSLPDSLIYWFFYFVTYSLTYFLSFYNTSSSLHFSSVQSLSFFLCPNLIPFLLHVILHSYPILWFSHFPPLLRINPLRFLFFTSLPSLPPSIFAHSLSSVFFPLSLSPILHPHHPLCLTLPPLDPCVSVHPSVHSGHSEDDESTTKVHSHAISHSGFRSHIRKRRGAVYNILYCVVYNLWHLLNFLSSPCHSTLRPLPIKCFPLLPSYLSQSVYRSISLSLNPTHHTVHFK